MTEEKQIDTGDAKATDGFEPSKEEQVMMLQHLGDETIVDKQHKVTVNLTKLEAEKRASLVEEVEYNFQLALNKGDYYLGSAQINFYLTEDKFEKGELFINTQALAMTELTINDNAITDGSIFDGQKIALETPQVQPGWNTVTMKYLSAYNKNSVGLYTFTDSKDDLQYLTSQFEAFHCFRVFPCFDQPSIKAKMTLTVTCPKDWSPVSNGIETRYEYSDNKKGQHVVERNNMQWFFDFYDKEQEVSIVQFE